MNKFSLVKLLLLIFLLTLAIGSFSILTAPIPSYRAERIFFGYMLPVFQNVFIDKKDHALSFTYEKPEALRDLKDAYKLDQFVDAKSDLNTAINLMHWVRDQFPHGTPTQQPNPQAFDGLKLLQNVDPKGYFCGTAAQLFIQAYTATGGYARRVQLRFTPGDQHSVAEAWIKELNKWVVFDVDYDLFYTVNDVPQNALELHDLWANSYFDLRLVIPHTRQNPHNIFKENDRKLDQELIRRVFDERNWKLWDKTTKTHDPDYYHSARFSVKLLNYYGFIFYPARNDWKTRHLPWWHPEGNRFQGSLVIQKPTMPVFEDFLWISTDENLVTRSPLQ